MKHATAKVSQWLHENTSLEINWGGAVHYVAGMSRNEHGFNEILVDQCLNILSQISCPDDVYEFLWDTINDY